MASSVFKNEFFRNQDSSPSKVLIKLKKSSESGTLKEIIPSSFDPVVELSELDGTDGFKINGEAAGDESGQSVSSAGDINGDNIDDIVVGARFASPNGKSGSGRSYVVFGTEEWEGELNLEELDGTNGFKINGEAAGDLSGYSVSSAGDINGDDIDDIVVGAPSADFNGYNETGRSYVVFGNEDWEGELNLEDLDGTNGVKINGRFSDFSGASVSSAGDINGDDIDDIVVGAPRADSRSGRSYVVFGNEEWEGELNLEDLDGTNGVKINGEVAFDLLGASVSSAGDINGDDIDDIVIGAYRDDSNGYNSGGSYVVFGTEEWEGELNLEDLDGTNGVKINGEAAGDYSGSSVSSAGDINGDDIDDIVVGAGGADPNGERSGRSYVVFGNEEWEGELNLEDLDGTNGVKINGEVAFDFSGASVSSAGDINGDNIDDIVIGAVGADPRGNDSGRSYVVFGTDGEWEGELNLEELDGTNGFKINGEAAGDRAGFSVSSAGDINGDDIKDIVVGTRDADPNGERSGRSYVIFGKAGIEIIPNKQKVVEGLNNQAVVRVKVEKVTEKVTIEYRTEDGTARAGLDYREKTGKLTFSPGETSKKITIPIVNNNQNEAEESFTFILENPSNKAFSGEKSAVINISDTQTAAKTTTLRAGVENLLLTGRGNINGTGNNNNNILTGNSGNNTLGGKAGNDQLNGKAGNDLLNGGAGADTMSGGKGNDSFKVENAKDVVKEEGNSGTDTVFSLITRKLGSNQENLILEGTLPINGTGNSLANVITGNGKENNLTGLGGNDQLVGKAGKDILTGGTGKDILTGGTGGDRFNYNFPSEGIDTITDFKKAEGDKIYISATGFKGGLGAGPLPSDKFVVGSAALDSGDRFIYNQGKLFYDVNGSLAGNQIQIASLTGAPVIAASDIIIF